MSGILVVQVKSGLCNRLRALLCAIAYSEVTNRKLLISWPKSKLFGAAIDDIWQHPYQEIGDFRKKLLVGLAGGYHTSDSLHLQINHPIVCIKTNRPFCVSKYPAPLVSYLSRLSLIESLKQKVECFASQWFHNNIVVGVSIRYNKAHLKTLEASPPEWFIHRINEIHAQFPNVLFFLSTDCKEVSEQVRSSTQASICEFPRNYHINQTDSLQEAVCDLYLLARTNYILASYWSSFSTMACWMQGQLTCESSKNRPDEALMAEALTASV